MPTQYMALYFRWGQPLVTTSSTSTATDPLINMLIQHVKNHNRTDYHQIPLLFPTTRRTFTSKNRISTIDRRFFHWKDSQDPTLRPWKHAPRKLFQGLQTGDMQLQPFFQSLCLPSESSGPPIDPLPAVSFTPFVQQLEVFQGISIVSKISTKTFRQVCVSATVAPIHLSSIAVIHWQWFWRLALTMVQRNVVYRYINHCIPHKSRLHRIFPALHPSDLCSICSSSSDSSEHFLFDCPAKASV